jgi:hypothetical protein
MLARRRHVAECKMRLRFDQLRRLVAVKVLPRLARQIAGLRRLAGVESDDRT